METNEEKIKKQICYKVNSNSVTYIKLIDIFVGYLKEMSGGYTTRIYEKKISEIIGFERNSKMMHYPALYFCNQELYLQFKIEWNITINNKDLELC